MTPNTQRELAREHVLQRSTSDTKQVWIRGNVEKTDELVFRKQGYGRIFRRNFTPNSRELTMLVKVLLVVRLGPLGLMGTGSAFDGASVNDRYGSHQ